MGGKRDRLILASVFAPLLGVLGATFVQWLVFTVRTGLDIEAPLITPNSGFAAAIDILTYMFAISFMYFVQWSYVALLLTGIPAHVVLFRRGRTQLRDYLLAGLIAGVALGLICYMLFGLISGAWSVPTIDSLVTSFAMHGVGVALAFWLIRRPDRDTSPLRSPDTPQA